MDLKAIINEYNDEFKKTTDEFKKCFGAMVLEEELEQEKSKMANEIKQEIVEIAFAAAEKIVAKEIDQNKYLDIVDEILKETK